MAQERIRVFCIDDHEATTAFYRLALELEPDMEFVGSCTSTADRSGTTVRPGASG